MLLVFKGAPGIVNIVCEKKKIDIFARSKKAIIVWKSKIINHYL